MNQIKDFLWSLFFKPSSGKPLAALRIVLGVAMLAESIMIWPYLNQLYGQYGYLQSDLIEAMTGSAIPGWLASLGVTPETHSILLHGFYALHIASVVTMTLGLFTRTSMVFVWISNAVLLNSGYLSSYGVDRYFLNLSFMMVFMPSSEVWSLDRWRSKGKPVASSEATFGLRLIQIFMLLTYFDAGHSKTMGTDWWNGEAIWRVLNQPEFSRFDFLWLSHVPWIVKFMGWGTIVVEMFYFMGVSIPKLKNPWVLSIVGLHLGIAVTMGLTLFGITLAFVNAAIFLIPLGYGSANADAV